MNEYKGFATKAIHTGEKPNFKEGGNGDVVVPIHITSTYARQKVDEMQNGYEYSRCLNPTRKALEDKLAVLENAKYALAFASGMAAEANVMFSLLKKGDHVIGFDDLYGGTKRLFNQVFNEFGVSISYVDLTNPQNLISEIKENTTMVWIESPSNPLLKVCDIREIAKITKQHNLILVVDNTFLSPYFMNPLDFGVDVVVHSATKYIGGHSDIIGGAVMLSDDKLYEKLHFNQNAIGAVPSPFDCYLAIRGLKTMEIRMKQHRSNALELAKYLEKHPKVKKVLYPELESHPQHDLFKSQARGCAGVISFYIDGDNQKTKTFLESFNVFILAESLGGVESLIEQPFTMTHSSIPEEERLQIGITENMVRVSVGIENIEDLIADMEQAFEKI